MRAPYDAKKNGEDRKIVSKNLGKRAFSDTLSVMKTPNRKFLGTHA